MNRIAFAALAALVTVGCSSQKVDYDYAHEADFSKFKTYAWHEDDSDDSSLKAQNPLANERVMSAVDQQLSAKGLRKVASNPDVYVTYHAQSKENMSLDTTSMGYGYGPGWGWGGFYGGGLGMGSTTTQVRTYQTGTLVVDIWDAKAKELVWRGIGSDTISDSPQKNAQKIDSAMKQMFRHYPPPAS